MAGYHVVMTGDFMQHQPVGDLPLFAYGNKKETDLMGLMASSPKNSKAIRGHRLWQAVDTVVILQQQHRFSTATKGGKQLWELVRRMWDYQQDFSKRDAITLLDAVQARVVQPTEMDAFLSRCPRAIVLRNELSPALNERLALNHAYQTKQRLVRWRCRDLHYPSKRMLSKDVLNHLDLLDPKNTSKMPTYMSFCPGMRYIFSENPFPELCYVTNFSCTGVKLILDELEGPDDLTQPARMLKYPPVAICVKPDGTSIGNLFEDLGVPEGCIPVGRVRKTFVVSGHTTASEPFQYEINDTWT
jgi:hypothetical protein